MRRVAFLLWIASLPVMAAGDQASTLVTMKKVFIDRFGGGQTAPQIRDMVISALENAHMFQITENEERADVILRGSGEDLVFTDHHTSSDDLSIHASAGRSGLNYDGVRNADQSGVGIGEKESSSIVERKHEASVSVRLVNRDGDVIWSATKESLGGKFRGASSDVADKIAKQLIQDIEKARQPPK